MECARMLKLGNLTEPEFLLACLREEIRNRKDLYRRQACP